MGGQNSRCQDVSGERWFASALLPCCRVPPCLPLKPANLHPSLDLECNKRLLKRNTASCMLRVGWECGVRKSRATMPDAWNKFA